jgi:four helix bundle protein
MLTNIAEGYGRKNKKEYIQALYIAYASTLELETQVLLAGDLDYVGSETYERLKAEVNEVERMLKGLIKSLMG